MEQIHEASRSQVQAILTPEQQQKFAQMKEEAKERRGDKKDKGTERPPTTTVVPNRAGAARKARFQVCISERLAIMRQAMQSSTHYKKAPLLR
jgi:hypothetical protein